MSERGKRTEREVNGKGKQKARKYDKEGLLQMQLVLVIGVDSQFNLLIINQYMRNTLNAYHRNPNSKVN